jgi:hypothetical protein
MSAEEIVRRGFHSFVPRTQTVHWWRVSKQHEGMGNLGARHTIAERQASASFNGADSSLEAPRRVTTDRHQHLQTDEFGCHGGGFEWRRRNSEVLDCRGASTGRFACPVADLDPGAEQTNIDTLAGLFKCSPTSSTFWEEVASARRDCWSRRNLCWLNQRLSRPASALLQPFAYRYPPWMFSLGFAKTRIIHEIHGPVK